MSGKHTIILLQQTPSKASRTFMDYEDIPHAMDGVCQMFEKRLKELNPQVRNITYDIDDLYNYIDQLADMSALVFDPQKNAYLPYNKEYIKKKAFDHLKKQAQQ
mmetsp:Transcript_41508/g.50310  ORF Transcript_41508/g.50310 Transcript_41508/m.50310 type:complete len:104 (+) Transcript_41508:146-457(+)|eukprot:CAMPEP_0197856982 /NCGR_PEP_ID=MMETSP1438-20131217/29602_1 /TAXON_ID=1461541 /ORGANISM="Pterosperma sp., Strain CCMP1384" /LENGTH=103 /DNA_ID=CAMNT_0043472639 /DNA_START=144 /DNA_END=455 /DNA_ORIENTATION=+